MHQRHCGKAMIMMVPLPLLQRLLSTEGSNSVCEGDSAVLRFDFTGTPPWSLTYTDGTNSYTVNNILSSPYEFIVFPSVSTLYWITALTDSHCSALPSTMMNDSVLVTVNPIPAVEFTWKPGPPEFRGTVPH